MIETSDSIYINITSEMREGDNGEQWAKAACKLRRRLNSAWWYQELTIPLIAITLLLGLWVIVSRFYEWHLGWLFWVVGALGLAGACYLAWQRARKHRIDEGEALARLLSLIHI